MRACRREPVPVLRRDLEAELAQAATEAVAAMRAHRRAARQVQNRQPGSAHMGRVHPDPRTTTPAAGPVERLADLTATQIGRLLGVPPRTVHGWLDGAPVPARHAELLDRLTALVHALPGGTPAARHAALLDSTAGPSLFHAWTAALPQAARLQTAAVPVLDRLTA